MRSSYRNLSPLAKKAAKAVAITGGIGTGVLTYNLTSKELLFTRNKTSSPHPKLAEWQEQLNHLNAAINEDKDSSYVIAGTGRIPDNVFRGSLLEYLVKHRSLHKVDTIQLTGNQIRPGIFNSSVKWSEENFRDFMEVIAAMKIKRLGLTGCELSPNIGKVLGEALKTNDYLEELLVTSNQLEKEGLIALLNGLEKNAKLKTLYSRSYNIECYYWSCEELNALAKVVRNNITLKEIDLPDNQISNPADIRILVNAYRTAEHKNPVIINGFEVRRSASLPPFTKKGVIDFENFAKIRFKSFRDS